MDVVQKRLWSSIPSSRSPPPPRDPPGPRLVCPRGTYSVITSVTANPVLVPASNWQRLQGWRPAPGLSAGIPIQNRQDPPNPSSRDTGTRPSAGPALGTERTGTQ